MWCWCGAFTVEECVAKSCNLEEEETEETNLSEIWLILDSSTVVYENQDWNREGVSEDEIFVLGINNEESGLESGACRRRR